MTVVLTPPNTMPRINSVFAYLSVDKDGSEGVCAAPIGPGGTWMPLIAADADRLKSITPVAEQVARESGMTNRAGGVYNAGGASRDHGEERWVTYDLLHPRR
jgi:hypothetical protein